MVDLNAEVQAAEAAALTKFAKIKVLASRYGPWLAAWVIGFFTGKVI
jgi:hypothetical protein